MIKPNTDEIGQLLGREELIKDNRKFIRFIEDNNFKFLKRRALARGQRHHKEQRNPTEHGNEPNQA